MYIFYTFFLFFYSCLGFLGSDVKSGEALQEQIILLLSKKVCKACDLRNADLVHADLRNRDLSGSDFTGANLNNSILDGSKLENVNLTDANLNGASLRYSDLSGAVLNGTDLRNSDLTGIKFDTGALSKAYWRNSIGVELKILSYEELHNAGSEFLEDSLFQKAEYYFDLASKKNVASPISLMALAYTQIKLGKLSLAQFNLKKAQNIYIANNNEFMIENISSLKKTLDYKPTKPLPGNGIGSKIIQTSLSSLSLFARPVFTIPQSFTISY